MSFLSPLPENWKEVSTSDGNLPKWEFKHEYLDLNISLMAFATPEELGIEAEQNHVYDIYLQWSDVEGFGVEDTFQPDDIMGKEEGGNWCLALMSNINEHFVPGDQNYVRRAKQATLGEEIDDPKVNTTGQSCCPICGISFMQYRGFELVEKARHHVEYTDDEQHQDVEVSLGG